MHAGGGTRTHTPFRTPGPKPGLSTSSSTPAASPTIPPPAGTICLWGALAKLAKAPVSKTGDSRFESWVPRAESRPQRAGFVVLGRVRLRRADLDDRHDLARVDPGDDVLSDGLDAYERRALEAPLRDCVGGRGRAHLRAVGQRDRCSHAPVIGRYAQDLRTGVAASADVAPARRRREARWSINPAWRTGFLDHLSEPDAPHGDGR